MNNRFIKIITVIASAALFMSGCGESNNSSFQDPTTSDIPTNSGPVSHKNFSVLASEVQPTVIDPDTGIFTKTDVTMTAFIADRNNQTLTDKHTVFFRTEYGTITQSCVTDENGSCEVTWSAIKRPDPGGPGDDLLVTIVAYTIGEESFTDINGNSIYDDADGNLFTDLEEPYVDMNETGVFDTGDDIIDVVNGNDLTGKNGAHDIVDGFFNGNRCSHSSLCSTTVIGNATIWDSITLKIDGPPAAAP